MKTESIPASLSTPFRLHNIPLSAHPLHRKFSMGDATVEAIEWTENTVLYRAKVTQNPDSCISLLQAQFQEADRCIFVLRQVEADELYTVPLHKIYNAAWMDLRRVPDGRTLSRTVNLVSTHLVESGMGSLDEFAKVYDVDTSLSEEEDKVEVLQKALSKRGANHRNIFRTKLNALVNNLRHDFTCSRDAPSKT
ncbi:unnamed protein product [Aphanomyces euteiches]